MDHIGIDVHKVSCQVCVLGEDGELREFRIPTSRDRLLETFGAMAPAKVLLEQASAGGRDAFVRKYDPDGTVLWARQFGTALLDTALAVVADTLGAVIVAGDTYGQVADTNQGAQDAFLRKYDADGAVLWTRQFGTVGIDYANGVDVHDDGSILVCGDVSGDLEGVNVGRRDAYVRKYDASGVVLWTRQFGSTDDDEAHACAVDGAGHVIVVGNTFGALAMANAGVDSRDLFARIYNADGAELWTRQRGGVYQDHALAVHTIGLDVYVAGSTSGTLAGTSAGSQDAFVWKLVW